MAHGACGEQFKAAFTCFVTSEAEPKGADCVEHFVSMRDCMLSHPEEYPELSEEEKKEEGDAVSPEPSTADVTNNDANKSGS